MGILYPNLDINKLIANIYIIEKNRFLKILIIFK